MRPFIYQPNPPRVVFGAGALQHLGREIDVLGACRALILSTPGQAASAHRLAELLGKAIALDSGLPVLAIPTT